MSSSSGVNSSTGAEAAIEPTKDGDGLEPINQVLRLIFGLLFLCGGLYIYYFVLTALNGILSGTASYAVLDQFSTPEARTLSLPGSGEQIALPPVFFTGMGYGVVIFIASVVVSIANNLIRTGAGLIQPDARILIKRLRKELNKKSG